MTPYTWRGKTYKSVVSFTNAVMKAYPRNSRIGFNEDTMRVQWKGGRELLFEVTRNPTANAVAAEPFYEGKNKL